MLGKRLLFKLSLIGILVLIASAYSPIDFLGIYNKINIADAHLYDGQSVELIGRIYHKEIKNDQPIYYVKCSAVYIDGGILKNISLILNLDSDIIPNNSKIKAVGEVECFSVARNHGNFDSKSYYNSLGLVCRLKNVKIESCENSFFTKNDIFYRFNKLILNEYKYYLPGEEAGFLASITIGNKAELQGELKTLFQEVGVAHVLAVSGLHVGVVCMGLYSLLRKRGISFLFSGAIAGIIAFMYCLFTGGSVSSVRAVGMFLIFIMAQILGEVYDMQTAVAVVADIILFTNPMYIKNSSFIFSFSAVVIVICIARPLTLNYKNYCKEYMEAKIPKMGWQAGFNKTIGRRILEKFVSGFIFSFALTIGMLPITTLFFYQTPMYSLVLNTIVLPIMPILLGLGLIGGVLGIFMPFIGFILLIICHYIIYFYEMLADICDKLPGTTRVTGVHGIITIIVYYLLLIIVVHNIDFIFSMLCNISKNKDMKSFTGHFLIIKLLAMTLISLIILIPKHESFEIDILDVGQGDGIYISSGDGVSFMIDGGSTSETDLVQYRLLPFLKYKGRNHIDFWLLTHMDLDHVSGILELLEQGYDVDTIVLSAQIPEGETLTSLLSLAKANGTNIIYMNKGDILATKHLKLRCVFPYEGYTSEDVNDMCLSVVLEYDYDLDGELDYRAFFGGDIGVDEEQAIAASNLVNEVDLLKVSHHGSKYSSDSTFLHALSPDIAVISCAKENSYGHPSMDAVNRIEEVCSNLFFTMYSGEISIKREGKEFKVSECVEYNLNK